MPASAVPGSAFLLSNHLRTATQKLVNSVVFGNQSGKVRAFPGSNGGKLGETCEAQRIKKEYNSILTCIDLE